MGVISFSRIKMMKKIFYYIVAAVLTLGLESCAKEAVVPEEPATSEVIGQMTIVADIEDGSSAKATLSGDDQTGYQVLWSEGDQIILVNQSNISITTVYTLSEGAGSTSGTFVGDAIPDGEYMAYYAYNRNKPEKFGEQTADFEESVSHAPMTAIFTVSGGVPSSIVFRNACGLLCLNLKGTGTVKSITISTNEGLVSHYANFREDGSMGVQDPKGNPAERFITLDCGYSGRGLTESYQSFYIAMPPREAYTGVKIDVTDFAGNTCTKTLKSDKTLNIARAKITTTAFTVTGLTDDNLPLTWDSPVGTVGILDGREAMVVEYGGIIGKVAIATKNVGANTDTETGPFYTWYDAIMEQHSGVWGKGWYMPSEAEAMYHPGEWPIPEGQYAKVEIAESSYLKYPYGGYYDAADKQWMRQGTQFTSWTTDLVYYREITSLDPATFLVNTVIGSGLAIPEDKLNIRPFHKLPITRNTPVGMIGYLDGKEAMVVEFNVNGQIKKVAVAIRNEGATHINAYIKDSKNQYLDCFGSYLTYTQAQSKCADGWYIPTIEEWQSLMKNASVVDYKLGYKGNFSKNDEHRAIVVNVNGNSLILPAGGEGQVSSQTGWQSYYWSSTPDGSNNMKCLWSRNNVGTYPMSKNTALNTRLFHAIP